jgi:hypothetical protein
MSLCWTSYAENEHEVASDARVSYRIPMRCGAQLAFETQVGSERTIKGRVLNMSSSGVLVEAPRPMAVGSQVCVRANELLVGTAYVRHSTRQSWRFRIGLEFATPVRNRYWAGLQIPKELEWLCEAASHACSRMPGVRAALGEVHIWRCAGV